MSDRPDIQGKNPSKAWYLFPIFLSLIGGLIMFFVLKDENRGMAKNGLILGVILTVVAIILFILIPLIIGLTYVPSPTFESSLQN